MNRFASRSGSAPQKTGTVWRVWVGAWTLAALVVCLTPVSVDPTTGPQWHCIFCGEWATRNLLLNILFFVPFGFGLRRLWSGVAAVTTAGFALSLGIELAQMVIPGRFPALGDVIANTVGAWLGGGLGAAPRSWVLPHPATQTRLRWAWSLGSTALVLLSGLLLAPSVPEGAFYGNWTPEVGGRAPYSGQILSASLGSYPLPSERLEDPSRVVDALAAGETLALEFTAGPLPNSRAALFRLIGEAQREVIRIDVDEADILVRPRYLATRLRLSRPELRFAGALAGPAPGEHVALTVRPAGSGGVQLQVGNDPPVVEALRPTQGWIVLSGIDGLPGRAAGVADFLWCLALFFPIGWWAATLPSALAAGLPTLAAFAFVPAFTALANATVTQLLAGVLCAVAGYLLNRFANQRFASG